MLKDVTQRLGIVTEAARSSRVLPELEFLEAENLPVHVRRAIETNYQARLNYNPRPYQGRVTLFRARTDPPRRSLEQDLGWIRVALGGVEINQLRGTHANIMDQPRVRTLAAELCNCLKKADQASLALRNSPDFGNGTPGQPVAPRLLACANQPR